MAYGGSRQVNRRVIVITVSVIIVVALALGLGLGLGLRNKSADNVGQNDCYRDMRHVGQNYDPSIPWAAQCPTPDQPQCPDGIQPPLILISLDGFRSDYLQRNLTPNIQKLINCGAKADYLRSLVPTKTFPNHYSIATGLYPESHGIIANRIYDLELGELFTLGSDNSFKAHWWHGEPIWNTASKHGKKTVTMFWPGSEANVQEMRPTHCYYYNEGWPFEERVNEIMGYFQGEASDYPSFVSFYLHEPDSAGHDGGPYSNYVSSNLTHVDHIIQLLMTGFQQKGLDKCVNIMLVADHGMEMIDCDRTVSLKPYFGDELTNLYVHDGEMVRISSQYVERDGEIVEQPDGATPEEILAHVKCSHYNDTMDWYASFMKKEDLPKRMHYARSHRIEEVLGDVEKQYLVFRDTAGIPERSCTGGAHGYDNIFDSMHGIFVGFGPGFKSGIEVREFENVELYNVMTDLLDLTPAPNNGTHGSLHHLLSTSDPVPDSPPPLGSYGDCPYPGNMDELGARRNITATCNWQDISNFTSSSIADVDDQLNLTSSELSTSQAEHIPLGQPQVDYQEDGICQLSQNDYILGYSETYKMSVWCAFKLGNNPDCSMLSQDCSSTHPDWPQLVRPDVRLSAPEQTECDLYTDVTNQIKGEFLFPPGLIDDSVNSDRPFDAHLVTNIVPMYEGFRNGVWQQALYLFEEYAEKYGDLQMITGPIFDYNADGRRDTIEQIQDFVGDGPIPIPTHFYMTASVCQSEGTDPADCGDNTKLLSVILPHKQQIGNCMDQRYLEYIHKHVARVRDIELLTDLRFFPSVPLQQRLHMEVYLSENLWDRLSWLDLTSGSEGCPPRAAPVCPPGYNPDEPPLLLISLDGFRPDYMDRGLTPTLAQLQKCGTSSEYMRSIYPTFTFPNHYTVTSGMYPESHGIVDNNMYDMDLGQAFWLGSPNSFNAGWWIGEPIWNNVEKNNKTAMTLFWPGSDVAIGGMRPTRYLPYNGPMPYSLRINTVLQWLEHGADGRYPDFLTLYLSKIDEAGHEGGPDSLMVSEAIATVDQSLKALMDGIYRLGLDQCINIMVTSDHGMTDMSCEWNVVLNDYIDMNALSNKTYTYQGSASRLGNKYYRKGNNYYHIATDQQVPKEVLVNSLMCESPYMKVFDKVDLPKRHHYSNSPRIDDVTFVTDESWLVQRYSPWCAIVGQHGWDTNLQSMQAFFTAFGPGFKSQTVVPPFENIELYNVMNYLMGIPAGPNNGTEGSLYNILQSPPLLPPSEPSELYETCLYPVTDAEYDIRANLTSSQCSCVPPVSVTIKEADERLDKISTDQDTLENRHLPHGRPHVYKDTVCILHQDDYVAGYSHQLKLVTWCGFTLTAGQGTSAPQPACLRPDVRLRQNEQPSCFDHQVAEESNMTAGFLFQPAWTASALGQMDTLILSNAVPMYTKFKEGIWRSLMALMAQWAATFSSIHVVTGPVFDHDADGRRDANITWLINDELPVPSHYYAIALRCSGDCTTDMDYETIAFVLPHKQNITNCMTKEQYLLDNVARIRDVELLTDLEFLTRSRTVEGVRARTFIPIDLWAMP